MIPAEMEILLVEDDPGEAELTMMSLRKEGLANNISLARDGAEALDLLYCRGAYAHRDPERPPALVLLDLMMPKLNGHDVLRLIKADERLRSIPIIVLTSSNHERDLGVCYRLGANSYIQKPIDFQKFQQTVHTFGLYWLVVNHMPPASAFRCIVREEDQ
jgi:two-component system response regulator